MAEHTEGPWQAVKGEVNIRIKSQNETDLPITVAMVFARDHLGNKVPTFDANAHLIAAAPDLLLACELVKGWIEMSGVSVGPVVWAELCRAIALARSTS